MSANIMPWFRMYTESVDDEKLRLLAFEDRWHFVAILCCKGQGILDDAGPLLRRKIAVKLGLDMRTLDDVARRLAEVGLLDQETLQPIAWDVRQMRSDSSAERVRAYRERMKRDGNVTVTAQEEEAEKEKEKEGEGRGEPKPKAKAKGADAPTLPGVTPVALSDWIGVRKAKRAGPLTETAIKGLDREAAKAGVTRQVAVEACCEYGWQGFNATWYAERTAGKRQPTAYQARNDQRAATSAGLTNTGENNDRYDQPFADHDDQFIDVESRFL